MTDINNLSFRKKFLLKAQSPLIHFQHDESGATLRATEVKPKLDAFLIKKSRAKELNISKWYINDTDALNYKMSFVAKKQDCFEPNKIYYGNMGIKNEKEKAYCLFGDCELEIVCMIPALMKEIDACIDEFFVCTNFGRMQNKGFGSFVTARSVYKSDDIGGILARNAEAKACYAISGFQFNDFDAMFNAIAMVYSVMKSGVNHTGFRGSDAYHRSYLFEYCHEKLQIGNEKAAMKKEKVSPYDSNGEPIKNPKNLRTFSEQGNQENKYVRALLGVGEQIEYIADFEYKATKSGKMKWIPSRKEKITISNQDIERLASPIFFKIINGTVYIVAKRIDNRIFGKNFTFTNSNTNQKITLPVPEAFDIDDFLNWFVKKYNIDSGKKDKWGEQMSYSIGKSIETVYTCERGME